MGDTVVEDVQELFTKELFLTVAGGSFTSAPVVMLLNNPYNIYGLLRQHIKQKHLAQPDKFWNSVRNETDPPRGTWRPRLHGTQIKSLQNARYPMTPEEWKALEHSLQSLEPFLESTSTPEQLFRDIQVFIVGLEHIWANQKRPGGALGQKRSANQTSDSSAKKQHMTPALKRLSIPDFSPSTDAVPNQDGTTQQVDEAGTSALAKPSGTQSKTMVMLNVGGEDFFTTAATLASVPNSFFYKLAKSSDSSTEFFIDRSPKVFPMILEYLRAVRYGEEFAEMLPDDVHSLELLLRESLFYNLIEFASVIQRKLGLALNPTFDIVSVQGESPDDDTAASTQSRLLNEFNEQIRQKTAAGRLLVQHSLQATRVQGPHDETIPNKKAYDFFALFKT